MSVGTECGFQGWWYGREPSGVWCPLPAYDFGTGFLGVGGYRVLVLVLQVNVPGPCWCWFRPLAGWVANLPGYECLATVQLDGSKLSGVTY